MQGYDLNYLDIDKEAYAVYKYIKHFKPYILKSDVKVIVPHPTVQSLLIQKGLGEWWANWKTYLQEYDMGFKLAHTIKGHWLFKLNVEVLDPKMEEEIGWGEEISMYNYDSLHTLNLQSS